MDAEIIYYTDCKQEDKKFLKECRKTIENSGLPIISVSLKQNVKLGRNIKINGLRAQTTLFMQIMLGALMSEARYVFLCEHDVLYHPTYFKYRPPTDDKYYYNSNAYKYRLSDRKMVHYKSGWLSQLCCNRELLVEHYIKRFKRILNGFREYGYEPGSGQSRTIDTVKREIHNSEYPNIDIRHGGNLTGVNRMAVSEFKNKKNCEGFREININNVPGWDTKFLLSL